jgi:hypothetical protein
MYFNCGIYLDCVVVIKNVSDNNYSNDPRLVEDNINLKIIVIYQSNYFFFLSRLYLFVVQGGILV